MRFAFFLLLFAGLLATSSATSFLGYHYLSLAGEYRARNMTHLDHAQRLASLIEFRPGLSADEVDMARSYIATVLLQAQWCTDNLSALETRIFIRLGAEDAFDICRDTARTAQRALDITDGTATNGTPQFAMATGALFDLRREAALMREQSLTFQPEVDEIEENLRAFVAFGTLVTAIGLGALFAVGAWQLWRFWRDLTKQHDALVKQRAELEQANDEISYNAAHDALTGLPNRRALDQHFNDRHVAGEDITLVRIDLDHFKTVNDTAGHEAGDFVLKSVAVVLERMAPRGCVAARLGGDEFVILMGPGATEEETLDLCADLLEEIRQPMLFSGKTLQVGASFGIASSRSGLLNGTELHIAADAALYEAKGLGRNRVHLYSETLHAAMLKKAPTVGRIEKGHPRIGIRAICAPTIRRRHQ